MRKIKINLHHPYIGSDIESKNQNRIQPYILEKDGVRYRTTSFLYMRIANELLGYKYHYPDNLNYPRTSADMLLPRLTKVERDKYKVLMRLNK